MKVHRKNNPGKQKVFVDIDETICFYENDRIYELAIPSKENIDQVIVDAVAAKGQSQPILVHSKNDNKSKPNKTSAA